jgi:hypothetical protein
MLLLMPLAAHAAGMTPTQKGTGYCQKNTESYCYEWTFSSDPTIRFVSHGDEDVIAYSFYRVETGGGYALLVDVHAVLNDETRPNKFFWAYPWDIGDIALAPSRGEPVVLATYKHELMVADVDGETISSDRLPAVLFLGRSTQPSATGPHLQFKGIPLSRLTSKVRR